MKYRWIVPTLMLSIGLTLRAESPAEIRLLVRGDDMGFSHTANVACIKAYQEGVMRSVEVMVPTPWFAEAVEMLKEYPELDVGVHLTLTAEWETIKWGPLTDAPSLTDEDGYFFPMVRPNDNYPPERSILGADWKLDEIERELRAQIELAKRKIPQVSHVTSHMGFTRLSEDIARLVRRLAKEYGIDIDTSQHGVKSAGGYSGPRGTSAEKTESFIRTLENLTPGTWLFVDHPGFDTPELRAVFHAGYRNVAADRQGVTDAWTSQAVKDTVKRSGIKLISYADLVD
jgi:predicted glycoside hydrolase/deacetylase ChbG (UPF0249 family)